MTMSITMFICLALLICVAPASSHRPLTLGATGGEQYSTWQTALLVPSLNMSWAVDRFVECQYPHFWLTWTTSKPDQQVHVQAGTPGHPNWWELRPDAILFGPGLPPMSPLFNLTSSPTAGGISIPGTEGPTTCDFLENQQSKRAYQVNGTRCAYWEKFGGHLLYITLDKNLTLSTPGTYYLLTYLPVHATGRYWMAIGNWEGTEDFVRPYKAPAGNRGGAKFHELNPQESVCCPTGTTGPCLPQKAKGRRMLVDDQNMMGY